ncbi:trypsin-like peptidase domain-containing protein [Calothrix sp. FACHB-1219]|uniref:LamG-like jellyroll fold domain-containing protein n=1 Tax=unclassified Calothrix TaxID=2619626 RepID=UPI001687EBD6|nr:MULTISPECIES: LamG-like jellyroll fold domain-containing protein [unclassified Calothrix]MBD2207812.1 trypsin-like peptidase domain-containing protein [Calothrix sp. FACHB-168]MBD2222355.1 trypsin-like peptidase domain-containing protein [Calothrix sp. FACHB-1219]
MIDQLNLVLQASVYYYTAGVHCVSRTIMTQLNHAALRLQGNITIPKTNIEVVSSIGILGAAESPEIENFSKVFEIVRTRSLTEQHFLVSVDPKKEPHFLPISFLEEGIKQSASVCRIARYFSMSEFRDFVKDLEKTINDLKLTDHNFNTADKVIEVFSIPQQIAEDIFNESVRKQIDAKEKTPLHVLEGITENQLGKILPIPIGSGFLVGGSHLLTNHHVIPDVKTAAQCVAQFGFVENLKGESRDSVDYEFDSTLFVSNPELDYTLVQLKSGQFTRQAGFEFGWIQLVENDENVAPELVWVEFEGSREQVQSAIKSGESAIAALKSDGYEIIDSEDSLIIWHPDADSSTTQVYEHDKIKELSQLMKKKADTKENGDAVFVVQHPKGRQKQIVLNNNEVITNGLYKNFLRYKADADYGSSGSPAFNTRWELVALHHAAVPKKAEEPSKQGSDRPGIACHQGIRTCRIVADMKQKSFRNPKLKSFIQDFVITFEQLNYPPLPAVARLNEGVSGGQKNGCFDCGNHESLDVSEAMTVEAWVAKLDDENGAIFSRQIDMKSGYWIWWFNGKIRVEIKSEGKVYIVDTKNPAPQDNLWHHVAFTWSKSEKIQIYIDGEQQEPHKEQIPLESPVVKIDAPVLIGGRLGANLSGAIAEVRLWNTERSQAQIKATMYRRLTSDYGKEGLIGYWQFEEDKASKTYVYNLASPNGGSKVSPENNWFGLELNGETDYIDCGNVAIDDAITFEAWVKPNGREQQSFIAGQGGGWGGQGYSLWWNNDRITVELQGDQSKNTRKFSGDVVPDDKWHHVAFTWSNASRNICIYIDGKGVQDDIPFTGPIGSPGMNFCIGRNKAITFYYFKGLIREVRLWKVARSEKEIQDARYLLNDEIKDTHLVGYWRLDEQTGNEAANLAGKGQPGVVYGGTWLQPKYVVQKSKGDFGVALGAVQWLKASECPASLPLPCGLKFNGKDDQVNCGHDPSLNATDDAITVEAWVKHQFGNRLIVSRGCYVDNGYSLCWHDGKIRVMLLDKIAKQKAIVDTKENAPVDRVWHHVAFTWDATSHEIFIYADGRQQDCVVIEGQTKSIAYAGQTKSTALFTGSLADLTTDLIIGGTTEKERYSDVAIAEVRLWKVVRTQAEIKTNMTCRLSRRDDDWQHLLAYWRLDDGGEGNTQARNLKSDSNHGEIQGARWFPAPPASARLS